MEWAEKKRTELAAGNLDYEPAKLHQGSSSPDTVDGLESKLAVHADRSREDGRDAASHEPKGSQEGHEDLLEAWLQETGHADEEWAEKLLGDREPSE